MAQHDEFVTGWTLTLLAYSLLSSPNLLGTGTHQQLQLAIILAAGGLLHNRSRPQACNGLSSMEESVMFETGTFQCALGVS